MKAAMGFWHREGHRTFRLWEWEGETESQPHFPTLIPLLVICIPGEPDSALGSDLEH